MSDRGVLGIVSFKPFRKMGGRLCIAILKNRHVSVAFASKGIAFNFCVERRRPLATEYIGGLVICILPEPKIPLADKCCARLR